MSESFSRRIKELIRENYTATAANGEDAHGLTLLKLREDPEGDVAKAIQAEFIPIPRGESAVVRAAATISKDFPFYDNYTPEVVQRHVRAVIAALREEDV